MAVIPTLAETQFSFEQPTADAEQRKRRSRIAEALLLQGTEATPIQHWTQGAARLAQALVGGYMGGEVDRQGQAERLAQAQAVAKEAGITFPGPATPASQPGFLQRLFGGGQQAAAPQATAGTPEAPPQYPPGNPVTPQYMQRVAQIESGGNPQNVTGSYKGTYQLSEPEFRKAGGTGSIFDPQANAQAAATKFGGETDWFRQKYGRDPTPGEQYMIHQQGQGGIAAHLANPDQPAWVSMASTGEGQKKGPEWAKQAIWGNVPDNMKKLYGSVDRISSRDFMDLWSRKVQGGPTLTQPSPTPYQQTLPPAPRQALDIPPDKQAAILNHLQVGNVKRAQEIIKQYEKPIDEFRPVVTPEERAARGIAPEDTRPYQLSRAGELKHPPAETKVNVSSVADPILEGVGKQFTGTRDSAIVAARQTIPNIHEARRALDEGITTGAFAEPRVFAQKVAAFFGIAPDQAANTEQFRAAVSGSVLADIKKLGTNPTNVDLKFINDVKGGNIALEEKSLRRLLDMQEKYARQSIQNYNKDADKLIKANPAAYRGVQGLMSLDEPPAYEAPPPPPAKIPTWNPATGRIE